MKTLQEKEGYMRHRSIHPHRPVNWWQTAEAHSTTAFFFLLLELPILVHRRCRQKKAAAINYPVSICRLSTPLSLSLSVSPKLWWLCLRNRWNVPLLWRNSWQLGRTKPQFYASGSSIPSANKHSLWAEQSMTAFYWLQLSPFFTWKYFVWLF